MIHIVGTFSECIQVLAVTKEQAAVFPRDVLKSYNYTVVSLILKFKVGSDLVYQKERCFKEAGTLTGPQPQNNTNPNNSTNISPNNFLENNKDGCNNFGLYCRASSSIDRLLFLSQEKICYSVSCYDGK